MFYTKSGAAPRKMTIIDTSGYIKEVPYTLNMAVPDCVPKPENIND